MLVFSYMKVRKNVNALNVKNSKEFVATITSKGQVTIPAQVRKALDLSASDKVIFRLSNAHLAEIEPLPMTLEEAFGSIKPINKPENFDHLQELVEKDKAEQWREKNQK